MATSASQNQILPFVRPGDARPYQPTTLRSRHPLVLLVEDHLDTQELYAEFLNAAGFHVVQATDGAEAFRLTATVVPTVVVTDIWMPGPVSAEDICRHFHGLGVPVLAVTAVAPGAEYAALVRAGCAGILLKPITPQHLVGELHRLVDVAT